MCGLAGFVDRSVTSSDLLPIAQAMADAVDYRGPDEGLSFADGEAGFAFGHRRLAIVDLSLAGRQPMTSACGRFVIVYNGEIYNAKEVAADLPGIAWRGYSDTEILLEACATWGAERAVSRMIGMFAFALWDRRDHRLTLVRDRLGIKPLYYGRQGNLFLFGSELKCLHAHPRWTPQVNESSIAAYLRLGYVPAPLSVFEGISKLLPGHILTREADGREQLSCYWNVRDKATKGQLFPDDRPAEAVISEAETLISDAVRRRMVADVPLGAFLSAGIDSSTVVALMQAQSPRPVQTFTIGFQEAGFNEADRAREIAKHLGTDHTELTVDPAEARACIPRLPEMFDEPFADYSMIPTFLVSQLARRTVTVSLSGDGGDEVFGGYTRYIGIDRMWRATRHLPRALRQAAGSAIHALPPATWDALVSLAPDRFRPAHAGDKIHKGADLLTQPSADSMYGQLVTLWHSGVRDGDGQKHPWQDATLPIDVPDLITRLRTMDLITYLPDDILTKLDRASMAVSLEGRVPLLDHRVVEFGLRLPRRFLTRDGESKWLLRQVLYRHVPRELMQQPKMGFSIPLGDWLRGPLRSWAEDLLSPAALERCGMIDTALVRHTWQDHCEGRVNRPHQLWAVLMLQAWLRRWT